MIAPQEGIVKSCFEKEKKGKRELFKNYRVDITVWKTLWKMCKTFETARKIPGDNHLWKNLRNNIFGGNIRKRQEEKGKKRRHPTLLLARMDGFVLQ